MHYRRTANSSIVARILSVHADIPAAIRDLLATLDLWADLSVTYRDHLVNAVHMGSGGRYAMVLTLGTDQFVLGPLCSECVELVAERVCEWTAAYPLATAEAVPWSQVAVLRRGRWVAV